MYLFVGEPLPSPDLGVGAVQDLASMIPVPCEQAAGMTLGHQVNFRRDFHDDYYGDFLEKYLGLPYEFYYTIGIGA